jgi:predicted nucleic acid-binding protein
VGDGLRLLDADILAYALYHESPAHDAAWRTVERALTGEIDLYVTYTTILETYNTLYWFYRVRPLKALMDKMSLTISGLKVVETSVNGLSISGAENIPLGDGFLIATALKHGKPIIVTNDAHIISKASKYGLLTENPIPDEIRKSLSTWKIDCARDA